VLGEFAPEAILDILALLDIINELILGALLISRPRVTASRMKLEVGDCLVCLEHHFVLLGSYWISRVRPIRDRLVSSRFVLFVGCHVCLSARLCFRLFVYVP
jgi:hypothetical protein